MRQSTYLRRAIKAIMAAGWSLVAVSYGDQQEPVKSVTEAMVAAKATDDSWIIFQRTQDGQPEASYIRVVWQGPDESYKDGEEIIADYSVNLSLIAWGCLSTQ